MKWFGLMLVVLFLGCATTHQSPQPKKTQEDSHSKTSQKAPQKTVANKHSSKQADSPGSPVASAVHQMQKKLKL